MMRRGHKAPEGYGVGNYPVFAVTVDVVILTMKSSRLHVLLVRRDADPYAGAWALPGGFKRPDETLDQAATRELAEETSVSAPMHLAQFRAYGDPDRDPRSNVVTVAYLAATHDVGKIAAGTDAREARLWSVVEVLDGLDLAFDHRRILTDALEYAADQLEKSDLATAFLGPRFALSELQSVYEELWGEKMDAGNFRSRLANPPPPESSSDQRTSAWSYVVATGERVKPSSKGGRPAELYRAGDAWKLAPPLRRSRNSWRTNDG